MISTMQMSGIVLMSALVLALCATTETAEATVWVGAKMLTFEGQGWPESEMAAPFDRLPSRLQSKVYGYTWQMSHHSAGMLVRFLTDSSSIACRWKLVNEAFDLPHMPATGVSGVDLYVRYNGKWEWLGAYNAQVPMAVNNEQVIFSGLSSQLREFALYFPAYNGVTSLEIGVADNASIKTAPPRTRNIKPVVFYGTSILQGGVAGRPGMAYPSIIGRKLDVPIINLGFSGEGKCEHEFSDILAELDPSLYVIDCLPNLVGQPAVVTERVTYLLNTLKTKRPNTPVVLVEDVVRQNIYDRVAGTQTAVSAALEQVYNTAKPAWGNKLYYVRGANLLGSDGLATVDGLHPTDMGFIRMADGIAPTVQQALDEHTTP